MEWENEGTVFIATMNTSLVAKINKKPMCALSVKATCVKLKIRIRHAKVKRLCRF